MILLIQFIHSGNMIQAFNYKCQNRKNIQTYITLYTNKFEIAIYKWIHHLRSMNYAQVSCNGIWIFFFFFNLNMQMWHSEESVLDFFEHINTSSSTSQTGQNGDQNLHAWICYATCNKYVAICSKFVTIYIFCIDKFHHDVIVFCIVRRKQQIQKKSQINHQIYIIYYIN